MARPRSANYADVRRGILDAAAEVFATHGYARSSIDDLTKACGLSRGALYHYFLSKEAILVALLEAHVQDVLRRLDEAAARDGPPDVRLARLIEVMVEVNAVSSNEQVIFLNDVAALSARDRAAIVGYQKKIVALFCDVILQLDHGGRITTRNRQVYTMMLFGILNYAHTWYDPDADVKPRQFARMAADLFLSGVRAGATPNATAQGRAAAPLRSRAAAR